MPSFQVLLGRKNSLLWWDRVDTSPNETEMARGKMLQTIATSAPGTYASEYEVQAYLQDSSPWILLEGVLLI